MAEYVMSDPTNAGPPGHRYNPEEISDDDYEDDQVGRDLQALEQQVRNALHEVGTTPKTPIRIDDDDVAQQIEAEEKLEIDIENFIDLTDDVPCDSAQAAEPQDKGEKELEQHVHGRIRLKKGLTVELTKPLLVRFGPGSITPQFLKITSIVTKADATIYIRGLPYVQAKKLECQLPSKLNEVCHVVMVDNTNLQQEPWTVDVLPSQVLRVRELRTTNAAFPAHRFDKQDLVGMGKDWVQKNGPLVCRYRFIQFFNDMRKTTVRTREFALIRISEEEADEKYKVSDGAVLASWRGGKVRGGSFQPHGRRGEIINLDLDSDIDIAVPDARRGEQEKVKLAVGQRYSAGDTFSGAGGASRGMTQAGLNLQFTIDHWENAVESMKLNFPKPENYEMDIGDFIASDTIKHQVDMLHMSPPCQVYSPAHTVAGKNDAANMNALFTCTHLVEKTRPRVFTLEQTFGLLHKRFTPIFNILIGGFTIHAYSVRWKVINLATYGLPQPRKRLIIIGAGPGEKLPPFPEATHSEDGAGGLKPFVTAYQATAPARERRHRNNPLNFRGRFQKDRPKWDAHQPLPKTITCSGGENYHWSGKRDLTHLEYALLQGFPANHKFYDKMVKKQIGNAFPPLIVHLLYHHLTKWLDKCDNVDVSTRVSDPATWIVAGEGVANPVLISDGEDRDFVQFVKTARRPLRRSSVVETISSDESEIEIINNSGKRTRSLDDGVSARRQQKKQCVVIDDSEEDEAIAGPMGRVSLNQRSSVSRSTSTTAFSTWPMARLLFHRHTSNSGATVADEDDEPPLSDQESATLFGSSAPGTPRTPTPFRPRTPGSGGMSMIDLTGSGNARAKKQNGSFGDPFVLE
ncbi:S-adenosyl-L-methionine-dependent methyltransferase [Cercophora newfieldiana]|uniref:DNA (cytosine-5-)-methyltransferase n=1 Tax=Cercophora newfieldiana TaxID=92897 RepID=A0AA39YPT4_9PEZI|nr:S-adenosyl-L-methionine-dependent methyltransferase [Cercophora newfieldiana]